MVEIIPGILEQDFEEIKRKVRLVENLVKWAQIDFLDGTLFGNRSFGDIKSFTDLDTSLDLEAHLMAKNPAVLVQDLYAAGFNRVVGHIEGLENVYDFLSEARSVDIQAGLALDIATPVEEIFPYLNSIDFALVMGIHTGRSGQQFMDEALDNIRAIKEKAPDLPVEVDGGINPQSAALCLGAGASRLAATSYLFNAPDIGKAIKELQGNSAGNSEDSAF